MLIPVFSFPLEGKEGHGPCVFRKLPEAGMRGMGPLRTA